ncbi:hypothetical protein JXJ21_13865 [candidate division KSB1 bacterium]|nr:hypothetical protein [candidate division KSB1 bacterium]
MPQQKTIRMLVFGIVAISAITTSFGIFSDDGAGAYDYQSIRGKIVEIYGKGIYRHMSGEVAVQRIAQDYVTLLIGIPLLLIGLFWAGKNSLKGRFLLAGTLGYFFVTFLFYTTMGMYNIMFLGYVALLCLTFFALTLCLLSFNLEELPSRFSQATPAKFAGGFLVFNATSIALLWLSIILPPLFDGSIYPVELAHYTTLIVQGLDLGLLLPLGFVSAVLFLKQTAWGYLLAPVYMIFLSILMTALTAKIIAMALVGVNVIPVIIIIPTINLIAIGCSAQLLRNVKQVSGT